jgi:hypothetical protein
MAGEKTQGKKPPSRGRRRVEPGLRSGLRYTVWHNNQAQTAPACDVLRDIKSDTQDNRELQAMSVKQYAKALVEDAGYFLPEKLLRYFEKQAYESDYERALEYLAAMPTSGVRILARD